RTPGLAAPAPPCAGPGTLRTSTRPAPPPPVITAPSPNAAVSNPPTITWDAVASAISYQLRIDDVTAGSAQSYLFWDGNVTVTTYQVPGLTPTHRYRAWLRAIYPTFGGAWIDRNFSIAAPLPPPI